MNFYLKKWPNNSVTLMTACGQVLANFTSLKHAVAACTDWSIQNHEEIQIYTEDEDEMFECLDLVAQYTENGLDIEDELLDHHCG